jgi:hypothetical protein
MLDCDWSSDVCSSDLHFLIGEAIFSGLATAIQRMRWLMDAGRAEAVA